MRIAVVFLMLVAVSVYGVSMIMRSAEAGQPSIFGGITGSEAAAQPAQPQAPAAQPAPAQPAPAQAAPAAADRPVRAGEAVTFTVRQGETTGSIAERLNRMGLVGNALLFRLRVQWQGAEGKLQAGDYQLHDGMTEEELITTLQAAKAKDVSVTFIEGRRLEEFAEALEKADTGIDSKRFLDLVKRGNFAYDFLESKPAGASLEGYLFPDTYRVIPGKTTAEELVHMMLKRFGEAFPPPLREAAQKNSGLNPYQAVTLASIVEREAQVKEERSRIAAVYVNRLKVKEGLFADPTIQYALGTQQNKPGDWWPVLRDSPRNIMPSSPYNSYMFLGLPPTPIANPGAAALRAVAEPERTDVMYFVRNDIKNDGSHVFSRTLAEHEANRVRYSRQ
ncbi:MAG: FIG004453: protein YceG like [uncultured Chloroflexi bacterium]|uniref:Endolytic murein transglycosylase n=1 Tax=uncultured Chloroflexota bacterium TaxID=166587 RepID=A0A6J4JTL3_9CHLR|nr:MAG: FIG004453: protein YceG like [uncultured Chloroflexota bacterium]